MKLPTESPFAKSRKPFVDSVFYDLYLYFVMSVITFS